MANASALWWRALFRGFALLCLLLIPLLVWQLLYSGADSTERDRLGEWYFALRLESSQYASFFLVGLAGCASFALRGRREMRRRSLVLVLLCGLSLLALEFGLRIRRAGDYQIRNARLGWWSPEGQYMKAGVYTFTPQGLRGPAPTPVKQQGKRVICLGDSFTLGWEVGDAETWPAIAARKTGVPFLNAGMPGYGVDQMATAYLERLSSYDHTAVILAVIEEDALRATHSFFNGRRKPYTPPGGTLEAAPAAWSLAGLSLAPESQLLRPWCQNLASLARLAGLAPDRMDHMQDAMERIRQAAGSRPVYLLSMNTLWDGGRHAAAIEARAAAASLDGWIHVRIGPEGFMVDGHPNPLGYEQIAAAVVDLVKPQ